ncbi:MAG: preprotein translocase subunit YajC [Oscillospiraceae bacterium]|jgi:preprotein translocase subunit YajC|nr:preprotein translocase subunit YajC [Oscillospiraceae bacterium]
MNLFFALSTSTEGSQQNPWTMVLIMGAMFAVMYFVMIRPQRKRQKEEQAMRDNIEIGDEITTIGGIMGRVVTVKEDSIVIETGADRSKLKLARWCVSVNNTANEKLQAERDAKAAEQEKARGTKSEGKKKGKDKKD